MPDTSKQTPNSPSRPAHFGAWALACGVFLLIWTGGLVTSYDAGMAVPDWPKAHGHNVFLYPPGSWLKVWDIFLEHGHRLLSSVVVVMTIALATVLWRRDRRPALWWMAGIALAGVFLEATLGGLRVAGGGIAESDILGISAPIFLCAASVALLVLVQVMPAGAVRRRQTSFWLRTLAIAAVGGTLTWFGVAAAEDRLLLAKIHGCGAPLFFALSVALVIMTSSRWTGAELPVEETRAGRSHRLTTLTAGAIYGQIVLGTNLRHLTPDAACWWFALWVWTHLIVAGAIVLLIAWLFVVIRRIGPGQPLLTRRILLLAGLFLAQLALGATTWVTNYGWPLWFTQNVLALEHTIVAEGFWQALSATAHVAMGSLCLAAATSAALWSHRLLTLPAKPVVVKPEPKSGAKRGASRRKKKR